MMFIIYKVTSPSNKVYVGLTSESLDKRKSKHLDCALHNRRRGKFQNAIKKYGDLLIWETIEKVETKETAIDREIYYIDKFDSFENGYNCTLGGESNFGLKHSVETKKRMSEVAKGRNFTASHRKNLSLAQVRHKSSLESRNIMAAQRGARPFVVLTKDSLFIKEYICKAQCSRELNVETSNISKVLKGLRTHTGGYRFIYKESYNG